MKSNRSNGEIVLSVLREFPSASSKKLAEVLQSRYKKEFPVFETARSSVRRYRGIQKGQNPETVILKIEVPESVQEDWGIVELGDCLPMMVSGDWHIPYHDEDAVYLFIERTLQVKPKTILIDGDFFDFYQSSKFEKDPRCRSIPEELDTGCAMLAELRKHNPKARIILKYGNHDERYDLDLMRKAPEYFKVPEIRLDAILSKRLDGLNIEIVKSKKLIHIHGLSILHGHEYISGPFGAGVNPARGLFNRAKESAMCAHSHQVSEHTEPTITGSLISDWSIGCLCGLHPQYAPLNKWSHGWAEIEPDGDLYRVSNRKLINYRMV